MELIYRLSIFVIKIMRFYGNSFITNSTPAKSLVKLEI